jgi:hypothetical protein
VVLVAAVVSVQSESNIGRETCAARAVSAGDLFGFLGSSTVNYGRRAESDGNSRLTSPCLMLVLARELRIYIQTYVQTCALQYIT